MYDHWVRPGQTRFTVFHLIDMSLFLSVPSCEWTVNKIGSVRATLFSVWRLELDRRAGSEWNLLIACVMPFCGRTTGQTSSGFSYSKCNQTLKASFSKSGLTKYRKDSCCSHLFNFLYKRKEKIGERFRKMEFDLFPFLIFYALCIAWRKIFEAVMNKLREKSRFYKYPCSTFNLI